MRHGVIAGRAALLVALWAFLPAAPARAQGTQPLRKVELVRLLGSRAMSKAQVASLVRRNCVTFRPSERDRADLRAAGADDALFTAIDQCLRARAASRPTAPPSAAAPAPPPPVAPAPRPMVPAPAPPLRIVASQEIAALAGTEAAVPVQVYRGAVPQPNVEVILRGASAVPGGLTRDPVAITDQRGVATFRILAGTTPGTYRLTAALPSSGAATLIAFVTTPVTRPTPAPAPAPPVPAEALTQFTRGGGQHGTVGSTLGPVVLEVRDTTGATLAGQPVTFAASAGAVTPPTGETDATGTVRVRVTLPERAGPLVITANVGTFSRTATLYADPGPPHDLVVERGRAAVAGPVSVRSRDTVVLRVVARDAYGNRTTLDDFTATTSGRAIGLVSAAAADSQGLVTLEPRSSGVGEVQVSGSGLRAHVPVAVMLPDAPRPWALGARSAWLGSNDPWIKLSNLTGISGADFTLFGRRSFPGAVGFSLSLVGGGGSLSADRTTGGTVSVALLEGYGRAELALLPRGQVSPVVSLGAGGYRLKSDDDGRTVYHTNAFWSGGVGLDVAVSPRVTLEVRAERQWMRDTNVGHVATFWPLGAGVRVAF